MMRRNFSFNNGGCGCWIRDQDGVAVYRCGDYDDNGVFMHEECANKQPLTKLIQLVENERI